MTNALVTPAVNPRPITDTPSAANLPKFWHTITSAQAITILDTHTQAGLSNLEVRERQARYGPNRLEEKPPISMSKRLLAQFTELIVWILIAAALIAGVLGEWLDTAAILTIVLMNGTSATRDGDGKR